MERRAGDARAPSGDRGGEGGEGGDGALWKRAMRDVAPLPGRTRPRPMLAVPPSRPVPPKVPAAPVASPAASPAPAEPPLDRPLDRPGDQPGGVDRATAERLKRGRLAIEGRLDLHGLTQKEAHRALGGFIGQSRIAGRRCVLVITGRGSFGGGILKGAVPRWLAEPELRRHLLASAPAQPRHGGSGALYLLLRRSAPRGP